MSPTRNQRIEASDFIERMTLPVRQAMAAVRWLEGRVRNRPKASEVTPEKAALTDADCVSQEILLVALRDYLPGVSLNVEEDTPSVASFAGNASEETVVIDPSMTPCAICWVMGRTRFWWGSNAGAGSSPRWSAYPRPTS